jgi:tetratricopeptide (TPR) repeat protein
MVARVVDSGTSIVDRFVGRAHELRQVEAACAAAAGGLGSVVVVSGEAGIGKSRLCTELARRAQDRGMVAVIARCWVDGGAPALWPWQPIVRALCGDEAAELLAADSGLDTVDPDRFTRFAAVTDRLAEATQRRPACLVIDDVHAADAGTLLLLRFVARSLPRLRLALVLGRRTVQPDDLDAKDEEPEGPVLVRRLLDDIEAEATPVVLRRFDLDESAALLTSHGLADLADDLLRTVHRVTGGNPLHLRRIAALGAPDRLDVLPEGVHAAIERSLRRLAPHNRLILRTSAVLGLSPSIAEAAAVTASDPAAVLDVVVAADALGLVTAEGTDRFTFGHELVRAAVESGLSSSDLLDAHAYAAVSLAATSAGDGRPDRLARRAHHALAAAPRSVDDARLAVSACMAAARSMVESFAYEQADALVSAAVALHDARPGLGPAPGSVLVEWAKGAFFCGRLGEARRRFDRAATVTEQEDDPVAFAEAALGLGGHWLNESRAPVERARMLALQRAARERLAPDQGPLRARLDMRLAAEDVYDGGPLEPVFVALASARECGDRGALAEALSLGHHALLAPEHADVRLEMADELVRVASEAGHGVLGLMGLCWRAVDLFLAGDEQAVRALEALRERADTLACQNILYIVDAIDVMLLVRAGRLDDAEAAAQRCYELGVAVGELDALGYLGAHLLAVRWIQGRDAEILDVANEIAASPTLVQAEFAFRATAAAIAARARQQAEARTALDMLTEGGLAALPRSSNWLVGMVAIVEIATTLDDAAVARAAYDLLRPYADRPVMPSLAVMCLGSAERPLGTAASVFGDHDLAIAHLERALDANQRLAHRPLLAVTQAELAAVLLRRAGSADVARASHLLDLAIAEATALSMPGRAATWRLLRPEPQPAAAPGTPGTPGTPAVAAEKVVGREGVAEEAVAHRQGAVRRVGHGWLVAVDHHRAFVADRVGMRYIVQLLRHPGQAISALALTGAGPDSDDGVRHEVLDDAARSAYAERIRELTADLAEAEAHADLGRMAQHRAELDALVDQIESATGLHGRPRAFTTQAERARTAVRKAIKRVVDEIDAGDPVVAGVLRSTITTGTTCVYSPAGDDPVTWSIAAPDTDPEAGAQGD